MLPSLSIILLVIYHTNATAIYPPSPPLQPLPFPPPVFPVPRPFYPMLPSLPPRPLPPLLPPPLLPPPPPLLPPPPPFKPRPPILHMRRYNPKLRRTFTRRRQLGPSRRLPILRPVHPISRPKFKPFHKPISNIGHLHHQQIIRPHRHRMVNIAPHHRIPPFHQIQQPFPAHLTKFDGQERDELKDRFDDFEKRDESPDRFRDRDLIDDDFERMFTENIMPPIILPPLGPTGAGQFAQHSTFNTFATGASSVLSRDDQFGRNGALLSGGFSQGQQDPLFHQSGHSPGSFGTDGRDFMDQNTDKFAQHPEHIFRSGSESFKSARDGFGQDSFHHINQITDNLKDINHGLNDGQLGDTIEQGFDRHFETGFDSAGGSDGFINDNFQSIAHMIPHAEPVFETNTGDGFLPDTSDKRGEKKINGFGASGHNADNPIEGLQLLGNSRWSDIINELASVGEHGIATPMDIPGEPVVVYPINPHATTATEQIRIPGEGVVLDPHLSHPSNDGPFAVETLDMRPNGLGHDAFAMLGIDPSTIDSSQFPIPMREVVDFTVTADKLAPEHPPPIPLPPRPKPPTPIQQKTKSTNTVVEKATSFTPSFSVKDGFTAIETLLAADVMAKTLDDIGT